MTHPASTGSISSKTGNQSSRLAATECFRRKLTAVPLKLVLGNWCSVEPVPPARSCRMDGDCISSHSTPYHPPAQHSPEPSCHSTLYRNHHVERHKPHPRPPRAAASRTLSVRTRRGHRRPSPRLLRLATRSARQSRSRIRQLVFATRRPRQLTLLSRLRPSPARNTSPEG